MTRKEFFERLRAAVPGVWNTPAAIKEGDELFDAFASAIKPDAPTEAEQPGNPDTIGPDGIALIKQFEGYAKDRGDGTVAAYPDPASGGEPWTIGWGSTGPGITKGTVWTRTLAEQVFHSHLTKFSSGVARALGDAPTSQKQFDAMVSLAYNVGVRAFSNSTLVRKHKASDFAGAADQFLRWNKAAGRVLAGLTRRRKAERALYLDGSQ